MLISRQSSQPVMTGGVPEKERKRNYYHHDGRSGCSGKQTSQRKKKHDGGGGGGWKPSSEPSPTWGRVSWEEQEDRTMAAGRGDGVWID